MTASLELGGHQNPRAWQGAVKELAKKTRRSIDGLEQRRLRRVGLVLLTYALTLSLVPMATQAENISSEEIYRGIYLRIMPADPNAKSDIKLVSAGHALEAIRSALDLIYQKSPLNAKPR